MTDPGGNDERGGADDVEEVGDEVRVLGEEGAGVVHEVL